MEVNPTCLGLPTTSIWISQENVRSMDPGQYTVLSVDYADYWVNLRFSKLVTRYKSQDS